MKKIKYFAVVSLSVLFLVVTFSINNFIVFAAPLPFLNEGNAFGTTAVLGTTDNFGISLVTNNSAKVRITPTGNFGIGTTSPSSKFHVIGTANITGNTTIGGTINGLSISSGTVSSGIWNGSVISMAYGGMNANLTASNGGIFYSTGSEGAILAGTSTAGKILQSGASNAPSWSIATYPSASGSSGNILTSDGTNWISATPSSASVATLMPYPNHIANVGAQTLSSNTTMHLGQVFLPFSITTNKISYSVSSVSSSGTLKIALYSEDGGTKIFEVTTAMISSSGVKTTTLDSPVSISPGNYYIAVLPTSTANLNVNTYDLTGFLGALNFNSISGEPKASGSLSVTASTIPSTINPVTITGGTTNTLAVRLDN